MYQDYRPGICRLLLDNNLMISAQSTREIYPTIKKILLVQSSLPHKNPKKRQLNISTKVYFTIGMWSEKEDLEKFGKLSWREMVKFMLWKKCQKHCKDTYYR